MPFTNLALLVGAMPPPISQAPHIPACPVVHKLASTVEPVLVEDSGLVNCSVMVFRIYASYSNVFIQEQQVVGYWDTCLEGQGVFINYHNACNQQLYLSATTVVGGATAEVLDGATVEAVGGAQDTEAGGGAPDIAVVVVAGVAEEVDHPEAHAPPQVKPH